jgi:hypothetical protein
MQFRATLQLEGKTATGLRVPAEVVEALGKGKRPPVRVTINGFTYRSTVAAYGDVYMLPVSAEVRQGAGIAAGDEVDVAVELDDEPRVVSVPPDFAEAIAADPQAKAFFDSLSYSIQRRYVMGVDEAKTAATRQRRIEKSVEMLREGKKG